MRKKLRRNGAGWNKGKSQGKKHHFTPSEALALARRFLAQDNWHDLALLSLALDSFLRAVDLLSLRVEDVCYSTGQIRPVLARQQRKTAGAVFPALTPATRANLALWIAVSGKGRGDYLFTRSKPVNAPPIGHKHLVSLIKSWAEWLGHPPDDYAAHSLRRTKAVAMYRAGEPVAYIAKLLGHKSEASTLEYLGITQELITEATLRHDMTLSPPAGQGQGRGVHRALPSDYVGLPKSV